MPGAENTKPDVKLRLMNQTGFWWILLVWALYGALHSLLASSAVKEGIEKWSKTGARRFYRLGYNLIAVVTLLPLFTASVALPDFEIYRIPFPWQGLSMLIEGLAFVGLLYSLLQTGFLAFLGFAQLRSQHDANNHPRLVVNGFYHSVRHPLYLFGLVILWLLPVMTWNLVGFNLGATIYILVGIQFEERKLLKEYGQAYADYQRKVPMLLPWTKTPRP
jgi:protein-S-isoprenylcysteine O-methyltransferase Ste14